MRHQKTTANEDRRIAQKYRPCIIDIVTFLYLHTILILEQQIKLGSLFVKKEIID